MPHVDFNDQQLQRLQETIRQVDYQRNMQRAFAGERALGIMAFRNPGGVFEEIDVENVSLLGKLVSRNADLSLYLETVQRIIESLDRSWPEARNDAVVISAEIEELFNSGFNRMRFTLTSLVFPALDSAIDAGARGAAYRDIVDVALAVQRYQIEHRRAPNQLDELIPEYYPQLPVDPFDGKTMRYRVDETEAVIYSIGHNDLDDGGKSDSSMEPDIAVRLPVAASTN